MRTRRWLAGVVLVCAVGGLAWWWTRSSAQRAEGKAAASAPAPLAALSPRANALLTALLPPARGALTIRGLVLGPDGPVAGATVVAAEGGGEEVLSDLLCQCDQRCGRRLLECGCGEAARQLLELVVERRGEAPPIARAVSGEDGAFVLSGLEEGRFALWAEKPGKLIGARRGVRAGEESADVEVDPGMTVRGRVLDDEGEPLAGAAVTAVCAEHSRFFDGASDERGAFALGPVPVGKYSVVAAAPGLLPDHGRVDGGASLTADLRLHSPRTIAGVVLRGAEPARARVALEGAHRKLEVETGADGRFSFEGLRPSSYELSATAGMEGVLAELRLEPGKDLREVRLTLTRGGAVAGVVRSRAGAPVADAQISLWGAQGHQQRRTGADGSFRIGPVAPGRAQAGVSAQGFLAAPELAVQVVEGATASADFVLEAASPLQGVVVDELGHPVEEASVQAVLATVARRGSRHADQDHHGHDHGGHRADEEYEEDEEEPLGARSSDTTRRDGSFALDGLTPGEFEVTVQHPEHAPLEQALSAPASGLRLVLARGLEIHGTLVDEKERPVGGAAIVAQGMDAGTARASRQGLGTSRSGAFRIGGLTPGRYQVYARLEREDASPRVARVEVEVPTSAPVRLKF